MAQSLIAPGQRYFRTPMTNALPANGTPLQVGAEKSQENARLLFIDLSWILIRLQRLHWLATCLYGLPSCVSTLFPHLALPLCIQLKFWLCVQIAMTHYQTQVGVIVHETHAHTSKPAHCPKTFMRTAIQIRASTHCMLLFTYANVTWYKYHFLLLKRGQLSRGSRPCETVCSLVWGMGRGVLRESVCESVCNRADWNLSSEWLCLESFCFGNVFLTTDPCHQPFDFLHNCPSD